jgi:hypothetical protein
MSSQFRAAFASTVLVMVGCSASTSPGGVGSEASSQSLGLLPNPPLHPRDEGTLAYSLPQGELFIDGAHVDDPIQGQLGDCEVLAAFVALSNNDPRWIENAMAMDGSGYVQVRLFAHPDSAPSYYVSNDPTQVGELTRPAEAFPQFEFSITPELPVWATELQQGRIALGYGRSSQDGEMWVGALEKALAAYRVQTAPDGLKGYQGIEEFGAAMGLISGRPTVTLELGSLDLATVTDASATAFQNGPAATWLSTKREDLLSDPQMRSQLRRNVHLVESHAYAIIELLGSGADMEARLRNPHGPRQDQWVYVSDLMHMAWTINIMGTPSELLAPATIAHLTRFVSNYDLGCVVNGVPQDTCAVAHPACLGDSRLPMSEEQRQSLARTDPLCQSPTRGLLPSCGQLADIHGVSGPGYEVHCVFDDSTIDNVPSIAWYESHPDWTRLDMDGKHTWDCQACFYAGGT